MDIDTGKPPSDKSVKDSCFEIIRKQCLLESIFAKNCPGYVCQNCILLQPMGIGHIQQHHVCCIFISNLIYLKAVSNTSDITNNLLLTNERFCFCSSHDFLKQGKLFEKELMMPVLLAKYILGKNCSCSEL